MINVIAQSTSEREKETQDLFNEIKPLLDQGYSYNRAVCLVKGYTTPFNNLSNFAWYKSLLEYGRSQGYDPADYKRCKANHMW